MSLLLDALNKADQERKRGGENPNISSNHDVQVNSANAKSGTLLWLLLGGVLLALLLTGVYWLGKKTQQPATATSAQAAAPAQRNESQIAAPSVPEDDNSQPAAEPAIGSEDENIASLYQHQARDNLPIPSTGAIRTGPNAETIIDTPASHAIAANTAPAINSAPVTETTIATTATSPMSLRQFANLPDIQDLPNSVLQRIPSLKYSEHNYNSNGGSVVINGIVRHANDQLIDGLVIDRILEDGMILHFENYSFKMRAMNTWVNM